MRYRRLLYLFALVFVLNACSKNHDNNLTDPVTNPPATGQGVQFDTSEQYFGDTTQFRVTVQTKDPVTRDVTVKITYTTNGLDYSKDFTTLPAPENGVIQLTIAAGKRSAYFDIHIDSLYLRNGGDEIRFKLDSAGTSMPLGIIREHLLYSTVFVQKNIDLDRGSNGTKRLFINFEKVTGTAFESNGWDLGFYTGQEDNRVILNSAIGMLAYRLDKNDITNVSAADTVGLASTLNFRTATYQNIDNPNGDLTKTAIAAISDKQEENKVYIINRRQGTGNIATTAWKKIRILRNGSGGYTLQHADIGATTYNSVNITKDEAYYFTYISFANGVVTGEPKKEDWDIVWTSGTVSRSNPDETPVPYFLPQVLQQNRNTKSAIGPSTTAYEKFSASDVTGLAFNTYKTISDPNWTPGSSDYRIIRTGRNKLYKFRFENSANIYTMSSSVTFRPIR